MNKYVLVAALLLVPSFAWLTDWEYRRPVTVTAATSYPDGPILVAVAYDAHMDADFKDIRLTDVSDNLLNYWIENYTASTIAYVWVNGSWATGGGIQAYVYYGKPGETSASDIETTFYYGTNFTDAGDFSGCTITSGLCYSTGTNLVTLTISPAMTGTFETIMDAKFNGTLTGGDLYLYYGKEEANPFGCLLGQSLGWPYKWQYFDPGTGWFNLTTAATSGTLYNIRRRFYFGNDTESVWFNGTFNTNHIWREYGVEVDEIGFVRFAWESANENMYLDNFRLRKVVEPEPTTSLGAEEEQTSYFTLETNPATPHVEEPTNFNVMWSSDYDVTDFWFDFDDGNDTYHATTNATHLYYIGGSYNATVIGLNASGDNYTAYHEFTVTEPMVYVWLQDAISTALISGFNVAATNSTNTTNYTTSGYFANWSYHEGPSGNVTFSAIKQYYNVTSNYTYVSNSTNTNFTLKASPAIVIIRPRDANYPNLVVPADVRMDNLTEMRTQSSQLDELVIDETAVCTGTCSDYYSSAEVYGQVWEYTLTATATNTEAGDVCYAKLYISDGGYANEKLIDWVNKSAASGTVTVNRILYVSEAGWEIRETDGTLVRSGTDKPPGYPLTAYVDFGVSTDAGDETSTATAEIYGPTSELLFYVPYGVTLGQSDVVTSQKISSPFAYLDTSYYSQRFAFPIYDTSFLNYTVYMFRTADVVLQDIYIIDYDDAPVQGAYVQAYGTINASELVSSAYSDGAGKVQLPLKATQQFSILVSANGYDPESVTVYPSSGALYITLTRSTTTWAGPYTGLSYTLDCELPLIEGQTKNVTMTIADSLAALANFTLRVWRNNTWLHNETSTSATGGVLYYEFTVPTGATWAYTINAEFYRTYNGTLYFHSSNITYTSLQSGTLDELRETVATMDSLSKGMISLGLLGAGFLIGPAGGAIMALLAYLIGLIGEGLLLIVIMAFGAVYAKEVFR